MLRKFKEKIKQGYTSSALKKNKKVEDITLTDIIQAAKNEDVLVIADEPLSTSFFFVSEKPVLAKRANSSFPLDGSA